MISIFAAHVYVPSEFVAVTFVTVGLIVSIPFTVTTISFVLSHQSDNLSVNVSDHENHNLGVYVTLSPAIHHVHLAQSTRIVAVMVSQDAAVADDAVFRLNVFAEFQIFEPYVKLDQLTAVSVHVTLHDTQLLRVEDESITL